jgi:hypothetical protein
VKYTKKKLRLSIFTQTIERLVNRLSRSRWTNVKIVFVAVYDDVTVDLDAEKRQLTEAAASYPLEIEITALLLQF